MAKDRARIATPTFARFITAALRGCKGWYAAGPGFPLRKGKPRATPARFSRGVAVWLLWGA
ncbi:MAG: hypothetical protein N2512_14860 [Armatimonadetes bacterium]|nr:hypothetical protein [Armatimonadota bacterium]